MIALAALACLVLVLLLRAVRKNQRLRRENGDLRYQVDQLALAKKGPDCLRCPDRLVADLATLRVQVAREKRPHLALVPAPAPTRSGAHAR
jgi:hypothetical protein